MSLFKKRQEQNKRGEEQTAKLMPFKSGITEAMVKEQLQKELDKYSMNMSIFQVTLMKSETAFSGLWASNIKKYRDFEKQTWSVDIGNERFRVDNEFDENGEQKIIFDAKKWAKNIVLQTGKQLSKKARSMFGGATVISGNEGNIFLKLGYCSRCKKKAPLISRHMAVARNYVDFVPEVCPYCLFKEKGYDIKIHKLPQKREEGN